MAVLAHPTGDDWGSTERGVFKWFKFTTAVDDGDTFEVPMAHPIFAFFCPDGSTPITQSVERDAADLGSNTVTLTLQLGASSTGTLVVFGSGV